MPQPTTNWETVSSFRKGEKGGRYIGVSSVVPGLKKQVSSLQDIEMCQLVPVNYVLTLSHGSDFES